ncbi:MAG: sugar transferase [Bacteroidales bacterium]
MRVQNKPELMRKNRSYLIFKRIFDIIFAIILLTATLPFLIIIAILIKLESKGPIFFKQKRLGKDGVVFEIFKFRTMVDNAEKIGDGLSIKTENDSRITKTGKYLRKFSFDELPQIINILKGEMSFIGPRPPVEYFPYDGYNSYPVSSKKRFEVKPGITGLSQVIERNDTTWEKRITTDLKYVNDISLRNDMKIFFMTIARIIQPKKLYKNI